MNLVRVYIATTDGPVEIQRLAEEDPEVRSVVCLNGTCEALPISPGYDAFVRKPTGVIERLFGHPVYRMDVAKRISEGRSWQLGVLAAHALNTAGRLAGKNDQTDHMLWITGEVDNDLKVLPVEHVPEKLQQSAVLFEEAARQQQALTLIIPAENHKSLSEDQLPDNIEILALENATELLQILDLETTHRETQSNLVPITIGNTISEATDVTHTKRISIALGGLAVAVIIIVAGFVLQHSKQQDTRQVKATRVEPVTMVTAVAPSELPPPELTIYELRAPQESNCAAVRFGKHVPEQVEILPTAAKNYQSDRLDKLCGLIFRLVSPDENVRLKLQTRFIEGDRYFENSKLFTLAPQTQRGPVANWRVIFPRRIRKGFEYEIKVGTNSKDFNPIIHQGD